MDMADISPAWIALIGTVFGGAGLKLVEKWLNTSATKNDQQAKFREEYRMQIEDLQEELAKLLARLAVAEAELNEWKGRYWLLREETAGKVVELTAALAEIRILKDQLQKNSSS